MLESFVSEKKPGRGADQFPLRFPEGMRDEVKRLADEDGRSMNTKLIELLDFALKNSGLNIDEILQNLADQRAEVVRLRKLITQEQDLATSVLWHVLGYIDEIPPELTVWADNMLNILDPDSDWEDRPDNVVDYPLAPENKEAVRARVLDAKRRRERWLDEKVVRILNERGENLAAERIKSRWKED